MKQQDFNKKFIECIRNGQNSEELLSLMKSFSRLPSSRALEVYREDYQARLADALKNTFRSVHAVLGDENFFLLARDYLEKFPSSFSDLDDYGDQMEAFLATHAFAEDFPFLTELAHFELRFRQIFHSEEKTGLDAGSLQTVFADEQLRLQLVPSSIVLSYHFSIEKIFSSCLSEESEDDSPFDFHSPQHILMFKKDGLVKMHLLSMNQAEILKKFHTPLSLSECIKIAPATMAPAEMQALFQIIGLEQILLKS